MFNAKNIHDQLTRNGGRASKLSLDKKSSHDVKINSIYYRAFSRLPRKDEVDVAFKYLNRSVLDKEGKTVDMTKQRYEDILWAIVNTKEFLFNH